MNSLPSMLLFQCHPSGALNFEIDPRFWKTCTLSGNQLCGEKHSGGFCNKIVFKFSLCFSHMHTGLTESPVRKSTVCLYVAVRKVSHLRHLAMFTDVTPSNFTCTQFMHINITTFVKFTPPLSTTFFASEDLFMTPSDGLS